MSRTYCSIGAFMLLCSCTPEDSPTLNSHLSAENHQRAQGIRPINLIENGTPGFSRAVFLNQEIYADILPADIRLKLTYCISRAPGDYDTDGEYDVIREAAMAAANEWERAADVNFIHLPSFDNETDCLTHEDGGPVFRIRTSQGAVDDCGGNAFAPEDIKEENAGELIVTVTAFNGQHLCSLSSTTKILLHEFGHILGLRHEMIGDNEDPKFGKCLRGGGAADAWTSAVGLGTTDHACGDVEMKFRAECPGVQLLGSDG